ncbi:hypothetical protein ACG04R_23440 [Roseateles sp. BYS78W]|uniref:Uncharacterized protein n=1 Tax=Pelomonas candidula TaxID=3299025 RepID=A0ABW7HIA9_9BURK
MNAPRWTLPLLAAGTVAAGLLFATRAPEEGVPAAAERPAMAARASNLPHAAPASAAPASAAPPAINAPASPPPVGSEGYGPHIERALAGDDIAAAWLAVQWLQNCASNEQRRKIFEQLRDQGTLPQQAAGALMGQMDAEARRCQTVTAEHRAMLPELAARAMRASVPLAAAAYAGAVDPASLTATQRQEVADALRRDAQTNGVMSLLAAMEADEAWGLTDAERLGFHAAVKQLGDEPDEPHSINVARSLAIHSAQRFKTPPTPEQQAAATLAGQQIVARLKAAGQP